MLLALWQELVSIWLKFWPFVQEQHAIIIETVDTVLAVSAVLYAVRQFSDAQQHKHELNTISDTLRTETGKLQGLITTLSDTIQSETAKLQEPIATLRTSIEQVHAVSQRIKEAVFTSPPEGFVAAFCRWTTLIHTSLVGSLPRTTASTITKEQLEKLIQRLLSAVAGLAGSYDVGRDARYAANVMIYLPRAKKTPFFEGLTDDQIRQFLHDDYALERLQGILLLPKTLSGVANSDGGPDEELEQIIFGIPSSYRKADKWAVLPGAPKTFVKWNLDRNSTALFIEAVDGMDDIREYEDILTRKRLGKEGFEIEPAVVEKVLKYYLETRPGKRVVSFQCYPLIDSSSGGGAIGVLNIHCDKDVFLGGPDRLTPSEANRRRETFASLIGPIVFEISNVVKLWWEFQSKEIIER